MTLLEPPVPLLSRNRLNASSLDSLWLCVLLAATVAWTTFEVRAFPPAPHHLIYGMVRDELGNPIEAANAEILFESLAGTKLAAAIGSTGAPGENYRLAIPMDSGITSDLYMATAMRPTVPFKIRVRIGTVVYLPIEMAGDYALLGQPGKSTRINLTLGIDSDGDGLPDAWERALISATHRNQTLADIKPGDDSDGDGLTNLDEYFAGTYAFDKKDGYALKISATKGEAAVLEFMAIRGRTYAIHATANLLDWEPVPFRLSPGLGDGAPSDPMLNYQAKAVTLMRVEVHAPTGAAPGRFFKLMIH